MTSTRVIQREGRGLQNLGISAGRSGKPGPSRDPLGKPGAPRDRLRLSLFAADSVAVSVQTVNVASHDPDRSLDIGRAVSAPSGTINI